MDVNKTNIESRDEAIAYWYRAADRAGRDTALGITYSNMAWLLEHPEGWVNFVDCERAIALLPD